MLLLAAAILLIAPPPPRVRVEAVATVRIERPARAGADSWAKIPKERRRQVIVHDDHGRPELLRLVENE